MALAMLVLCAALAAFQILETIGFYMVVPYRYILWAVLAIFELVVIFGEISLFRKFKKEANRYGPVHGTPGIFRFFRNRNGKMSDALHLGVLLFGIAAFSLRWDHVIIGVLFRALFIFTLQCRCFYNGNVYQKILSNLEGK